jgi:hypothetical protein
MIWLGNKGLPLDNIKNNAKYHDIILLTDNNVSIKSKKITVLKVEDNALNEFKYEWRKSDYLRLKYLSENENILYCDCDCVLNNAIIKETKYKAYFAPESDIYIMYGNCDYFKNLLSRCILNTNVNDYAWVVRETVKDRFETGIINNSSFLHGKL